MPDGSSIAFTEQLEKDLAAVEGCDAGIASGGGRMHVTMDRYEVTRLCWIVRAEAAHVPACTTSTLRQQVWAKARPE